MAKVVVANRLVRAGRTYKGGDVVEVSEGEARDLVSLGKARPYVGRVAKPTVPVVRKGGK